MYSGSDSADSQKYTQWTLNPAAYQNAANDQVDWAALAQQWIIMKEAGPPPIPGEQQVDLNKTSKEPKHKIDLNEGGEAPMEVETEKDDSAAWNPSTPDTVPPPPGTETWNNWNASGHQSWNWANNWNPPSAVPPPPGIPQVKAPLLPTPESVYAAPPDSVSDNAVSFRGYNSVSPSNNYTPGFWTGMGVGKITQTEIKPHNKRYSKVNVPTKVTIITPATGQAVVPVAEVPVPVPTVPPPLDANKRKQLPAWIREGLEKMERDKQKQLEKEREKQAREEYKEKFKQEEQEKMEILKSTISERQSMRKSRFDSDNENSEDDEPVKTRNSPPPPVTLSPEELMMKVRKTMTEILLKVTNQNIEQICKEERQRYIKKRRASDHLASAPSGAILSAKLGLGVYNDGSSSSNESDDDNQRNDKTDSDLELWESIKRRQAEFFKTEREIEDKLTQTHNKKDKSRSSSASLESNDNDSQVDAQEEEIRRSESGNEDASQHKGRSSTSSSVSSNYLEPKSKSRRSSSSSHSSSKKYQTSREKSRSHSATPERNRKHSRYSLERKKRSRSKSRGSSRRGSYRRDSTESSKRKRRSRSDSPYSRRSQRTRSRSKSSYSSRRSVQTSSYSSRKSRSRSRSRDRKYSGYKRSLRRSNSRSRSSKKSRRSRSRSYTRSHRKSRSNRSSSRKKSRSDRSRSRSWRRRSSRSSSRGKRSYRR